MDPKKLHGVQATSREYERFDQVEKPLPYRLAESTDPAALEPEAFDEGFEVRTCDLGRFLRGDARERSAFAAELGEAMEEIGFAILVGHGVDPTLFELAEEWTEAFFDAIPMAEKLRHRAARCGSVSQGYFPIEETSDIHPDQVEGWVFCRRAFAFDEAQGSSAAALWPDPRYEPLFRRLVEAETPLFLPVMQAILTHLGCDPHLYDERLRAANFGLRLNYYPPLGPGTRPGAGRLLGHEDVDLFTLLPAPTVEGLQVLSRSGAWVRLDAPPGSIVLNTGDYLQRLSNDRLPSTTHRVSPPRDPAQRRRPRVSFPLAAYLDEEEILEALPGMGAPRYEPIRAITFHTRTTAKFYGDGYAVE